MNKEFTRVRSVADIIISSSLIISGSILVAVPTSVSVNISGFFMIFTGVLLLMLLKTGFRDAETGERYSRKERYFPLSCRDRLLSSIRNDIRHVSLAEEDKGNGLKMDVYYSKGNGRAFVFLYEYVPYRYEQVSPAIEYGIEDVLGLIK